MYNEEEVWLDSVKISPGLFSDLGYRFRKNQIEK